MTIPVGRRVAAVAGFSAMTKWPTFNHKCRKHIWVVHEVLNLPLNITSGIIPGRIYKTVWVSEFHFELSRTLAIAPSVCSALSMQVTPDTSLSSSLKLQARIHMGTSLGEWPTSQSFRWLWYRQKTNHFWSERWTLNSGPLSSRTFSEWLLSWALPFFIVWAGSICSFEWQRPLRPMCHASDSLGGAPKLCSHPSHSSVRGVSHLRTHDVDQPLFDHRIDPLPAVFLGTPTLSTFLVCLHLGQGLKTNLTTEKQGKGQRQLLLPCPYVFVSQRFAQRLH